MPLAVFILVFLMGVMIATVGSVVLWATVEHREHRRHVEELKREIMELESSVGDNFKVQQMFEGDFRARLQVVEGICLPKREE